MVATSATIWHSSLEALPVDESTYGAVESGWISCCVAIHTLQRRFRGLKPEPNCSMMVNGETSGMCVESVAFE